MAEKKDTSPISWKDALRLLFLPIIVLSVLLISAGRLDWWEAWAYTVMSLVVLFSSRLVLIIKNPALAEERAKAGGKEDTKSWDRFLMPITALVGPFISWIIAGLDLRFGWSPDLQNWIQIIALGVIFAGSMLGTWAMIINRFFSSHVRIQTERGHTVISEGPYKVVRHPGYAGALISWLAAPVFFSSYWVIIPTVLVMIASVIRTALEDQTLLAELPGYKEYTRKVKYRLIPGIW